MEVKCCPAESVLELPVRVYPVEVYIPEDSIALIVQASVEAHRRPVRRVMGIAVPPSPSAARYPKGYNGANHPSASIWWNT